MQYFDIILTENFAVCFFNEQKYSEFVLLTLNDWSPQLENMDQHFYDCNEIK